MGDLEGQKFHIALERKAIELRLGELRRAEVQIERSLLERRLSDLVTFQQSLHEKNAERSRSPPSTTMSRSGTRKRSARSLKGHWEFIPDDTEAKTEDRTLEPPPESKSRSRSCKQTYSRSRSHSRNDRDANSASCDSESESPERTPCGRKGNRGREDCGPRLIPPWQVWQTKTPPQPRPQTSQMMPPQPPGDPRLKARRILTLKRKPIPPNTKPPPHLLGQSEGSAPTAQATTSEGSEPTAQATEGSEANGTVTSVGEARTPWFEGKPRAP